MSERIVTKPSSDEFRENFDRVFKKEVYGGPAHPTGKWYFYCENCKDIFECKGHDCKVDGLSKKQRKALKSK